ncbi:MAG: helix-turn-helix domain-containing protein [archaeon]
MIVQEDFLKKLRSAFDLNIYEVKIWTALLSRGLATAGELADISGVPRSRSYDVLESLEKRGFVIIKLGKPIKYIAVQPDEIVKRVKTSIKKTSDYQLDLLEKVKETTIFKEIELLYKQGIHNVDPTNLAGAIRGRNNLRNHMDTMLSNAEKTVTLVTSTSGFVRDVDEFKRVFKKLNENNVKIKIAAPLVTEEAKKVAKEIKDLAEVKHTSKINSRFMIVDGKELLFMVENDKEIHESYDTGIWVTSPFFASALETMFNSTWGSMEKA